MTAPTPYAVSRERIALRRRNARWLARIVVQRILHAAQRKPMFPHLADYARRNGLTG